MGTRWHQERRREAYHRRAKAEGYRSRSAYKLKQIDDRFRVLKEGFAVLDLGAAPGGWSQVLAERVGPDGFALAVDIQRMKPLPGVQVLRGDLTQDETHGRIAEKLAEAGRHALDVVVSDMAPDMSGHYDLDQARSVHLCRMALQAAERHLRRGGHFVCKVFEGSDFPPFLADVRERFRQVRMHHPPASRKQSSEVYLVARSYRHGASTEEE